MPKAKSLLTDSKTLKQFSLVDILGNEIYRYFYYVRLRDVRSTFLGTSYKPKKYHCNNCGDFVLLQGGLAKLIACTEQHPEEVRIDLRYFLPLFKSIHTVTTGNVRTFARRRLFELKEDLDSIQLKLPKIIEDDPILTTTKGKSIYNLHMEKIISDNIDETPTDIPPELCTIAETTPEQV